MYDTFGKLKTNTKLMIKWLYKALTFRVGIINAFQRKEHKEKKYK